MKKRVIIFSLILLLSNTFFALPNDFFISVEPVYSLQNGTLYEYVLVKDSATSSIVKMSELDWNLSNISFLGINLNAGWKRFSLNTKIIGAIPENSGIMTDLDWLDNVKNGDTYTYFDKNLCTTKSISESFLQTDYSIDLYVDASFSPVNRLKLAPVVGFCFNYLFFHGSNGYGWYGSEVTPKVSWDDPSAKFFKSGTLYPIDYERQTLNIYTGIKVTYLPTDKLSFNLLASVSPYTSVQSIDFHYSTADGSFGTYYYDIMEGYFCQYNINIKADYIVWQNLSVNLCFDYNYLNQINGITYKNGKKKFTSNDKIPTISACAGTWWDFAIGCKFTF